MKTTRQCYYMDRRGALRCRVVQEPRRRKKTRRMSPVKLGGLLALLAVIAGAAALLGAGSAPVSQVARVEVAAAPLPALATGVEGVSADDIGMALWTDFAEPAAEPAAEAVALAAEAPVEPAAKEPAEPAEEEAEEPAAEEPVEAEAVEEVAAQDEPEEEAPEETAQEEPVAEEPAAEEPAEAVAALEESADGMPDAAAMFLEDDVPAAAPIAVANASAAAIDVPEDERIDIQTVPEAPAAEEADAEPPEEVDAEAPEAE